MKLKVAAELRNKQNKKSYLKTLRKNGKIPAVIYGQGEQPTLITLKENVFTKLYKKSIGEFTFFDIELNGETFRTIIRERQIDPVKRNILHVDFLNLHAGVPIDVKIPFKFIGEPIGAKMGGVVEINERYIHIRAIPKNIPDDVIVDLSDMKIGDSIHIRDLKIEDVEIFSHLNDSIVSLSLPRGGEEETTEEEETE
jgi:large subunit ribosomal protein L25